MTEGIDRMRYEVRVGDTLRSIATNHPALADVDLWRLVAELNGMSTETDEAGNPRVRPEPGTLLALPNGIELEVFRQREAAAKMWQTGGSRTPSVEDSLASLAPPTEPDTD